jgi:uncharacterized membrane protein YfcA
MHDVLLAVPFGIAIGLSLGLVGGGGSILAVPVLVYVLGEPVREATTASLAIVGITAVVGAADYARRGTVRVRVGVLFAAGGAVGAIAGTFVNRRLDERLLLLAFAVVMLVSAYAMLRGARGRRSAAAEIAPSDRTAAIIATGVGIGVLTGLFGVGGGFVILPALVLLLGLPMPVAVGTSLLVVALTSASALAAHLATGGIDWAVAGSFAAAAIVGALAGSRLGRRLSSERLTHIFAVLVIVVACVLIVRNVR